MPDEPTPARSPAAGARLPPFCLGFGCGHDVDYHYPWEPREPEPQLARIYADLKTAGAAWFRPVLFWNRVEPEIAADAPADVPADADVEAYLRTARWREADLLVDGAAAAGIRLAVVLGNGYSVQLPWTTRGGARVRFLPDVAGRERYLRRLALHARAVVRRYRGRVAIWQLENELNIAGETELFRWRHGRAWWSRGFQDQVIRVLHHAVRTEDPSALTTHNVSADIKPIPRLYSWKEDLKAWADYTDILGIDAYPNYLLGRPLRARVVAEKVGAALALGLGKPVFVLESGCPALPRRRLFDEELQARYTAALIEGVRSAGGSGLFVYGLTSHETEDDPRWEGRGPSFPQVVERYWGMIRRDGTRRPAFDRFREAAAALRAREPEAGPA